MARNEDDENFKRVFKCCKGKTTNNIQCINCGEIFHYSCAKVKKVKFVSEKFVICCENGKKEADATSNLKTNTIAYGQMESEREIQLLKRIITEMEEKYNILKENNRLLQENCELLKNSINSSGKIPLKFDKDINKQKIGIGTIKSVNKNTVDESTSMRMTYAAKTSEQGQGEIYDMASTITNKQPINVNNNKDESPSTTNIVSPRKIKAAVSNAVALNKMVEVQKLNDLSYDAGEWKQQKRRRRRFVVGGNNDNSTIQTVPRLVALHVTRLDPSTTPDQIKNLLKSRFPEVECELHTSKRPDLYSSMKISINREHLKQAWQREVWPAGAIISFFQKKRMLQQSAITVDPL